VKFTRSGGQTARGPQDWFTGDVYVEGVRNPDEHSAIGCAHVRFTPGARTAWHSHSKGQRLYVTDGIGYTIPGSPRATPTPGGSPGRRSGRRFPMSRAGAPAAELRS
jgi:hypothetical protein